MLFREKKQKKEMKAKKRCEKEDFYPSIYIAKLNKFYYWNKTYVDDK